MKIKRDKSVRRALKFSELLTFSQKIKENCRHLTADHRTKVTKLADNFEEKILTKLDRKRRNTTSSFKKSVKNYRIIAEKLPEVVEVAGK